jgi:hypothetical protein
MKTRRACEKIRISIARGKTIKSLLNTADKAEKTTLRDVIRTVVVFVVLQYGNDVLAQRLPVDCLVVGERNLFLLTQQREADERARTHHGGARPRKRTEASVAVALTTIAAAV